MKEKTDLQKREAEQVETVERTRSGKVFYPPVDIIETDEEILLLADMPGADKNSIDITLEKDVLSINANVYPPNMEGFELDYSEYEVGDYQRSFTLSDVVDQERIEASYKNGVLRVRLPKAEPVKPKKITIETE